MNTSLRKRITAMLKEYASGYNGTMESAVIDALSDLRHICDDEDVSFHECSDGSYQIYLAEKHECDEHPSQEG